jgi:hypothetical protein
MLACLLIILIGRHGWGREMLTPSCICYVQHATLNVRLKEGGSEVSALQNYTVDTHRSLSYVTENLTTAVSEASISLRRLSISDMPPPAIPGQAVHHLAPGTVNSIHKNSSDARCGQGLYECAIFVYDIH